MVNPNLGINSQVTVDATKCCPRVCKSNCCGCGEPTVDKKVIQAVVKEVMSEYETYSMQHTPRKHSESK